MQYDTRPPAKYKRFEKVSVAERYKEVGLVHIAPDITGEQIAGRRGTIIWSRAWFDLRIGWKEWSYCVSFPVPEACLAYRESDLLPTGEINTLESQLGRRFVISYDTGLTEDTAILEGCYRLPGHRWQVFTISRDDVPRLATHRFVAWESGITGVEFEVPREFAINYDYVQTSMSQIFGAETWAVVAGPDSGFLKSHSEDEIPFKEQRKF